MICFVCGDDKHRSEFARKDSRYRADCCTRCQPMFRAYHNILTKYRWSSAVCKDAKMRAVRANPRSEFYFTPLDIESVMRLQQGKCAIDRLDLVYPGSTGGGPYVAPNTTLGSWKGTRTPERLPYIVRANNRKGWEVTNLVLVAGLYVDICSFFKGAGPALVVLSDVRTVETWTQKEIQTAKNAVIEQETLKERGRDW